MSKYEEEVIKLLNEIKDLLTPVSAHYEPGYTGTKQKQLKEFLSTETKRKIYSLLFDPHNFSQTEIAKLATTTQPSVSRLIATLLEAGLIEKDVDENGKDYFVEKFTLSQESEAKNE